MAGKDHIKRFNIMMTYIGGEHLSFLCPGKTVRIPESIRKNLTDSIWIFVFRKGIILRNSILSVSAIFSCGVDTYNAPPYFFQAMRQERIPQFYTSPVANSYV